MRRWRKCGERDIADALFGVSILFFCELEMGSGIGVCAWGVMLASMFACAMILEVFLYIFAVSLRVFALRGGLGGKSLFAGLGSLVIDWVRLAVIIHSSRVPSSVNVTILLVQVAGSETHLFASPNLLRQIHPG